MPNGPPGAIALCGTLRCAMPYPLPSQAGNLAEASRTQLRMLDTTVKAPSRTGPSRRIPDGGRDRDRTCDPYHVKKALGAEMTESQCSSTFISGKAGALFH